MIDEKTFAANYSFFWKSIMPFSSVFIRGMSIDCTKKGAEITLTTPSNRMSLISEIGFYIFAYVVENDDCLSNIDKSGAIFAEIEHNILSVFKNYETNLLDKLSDKEFLDSIKIAEQLIVFFKNSDQKPITSPLFKGCGFLHNCFGDIIHNDILYEVKNVNRNFNILDFRQLMTYCALNNTSKQYNISKMGIYNPRKGISYTIDVEKFANIISMDSFSEICWQIINFITTDYSSR